MSLNQDYSTSTRYLYFCAVYKISLQALFALYIYIIQAWLFMNAVGCLKNCEAVFFLATTMICILINLIFPSNETATTSLRQCICFWDFCTVSRRKSCYLPGFCNSCAETLIFAWFFACPKHRPNGFNIANKSVCAKAPSKATQQAMKRAIKY